MMAIVVGLLLLACLILIVWSLTHQPGGNTTNRQLIAIASTIAASGLFAIFLLDLAATVLR